MGRPSASRRPRFRLDHVVVAILALLLVTLGVHHWTFHEDEAAEAAVHGADHPPRLPPPDEPETTTVAPEPPDAQALAEGAAAVHSYLGGLSDQHYPGALEASTGPARLYVEYLRDLAALLALEPHRLPTFTLITPPREPEVLEEGRVRIGGSAVQSQPGAGTAALDGFVVTRGTDGSWRVESYRREGIELAALISGPGPVVEASEVQVMITHAFLAPPADGTRTLVLLYRVENRRAAPVLAFPYGAVLSTDQDQELEAEFFTDTPEILPGSSGLDAMALEVEGIPSGTLVGEVEDPRTGELWTIRLTLPTWADG